MPANAPKVVTRAPVSKPSHPIPAPPTAPAAQRPEHPHHSVLRLMKDIKAGVLKGRMLAPADRQRCVANLMIEGMSNPEIAEILSVSERTVIRDRRDIKAANALRRDPRLGDEIAGSLLTQAEAVMSRLRRTARDAATATNVKVDAERAVWDVQRQLAETLRTLGYIGAGGAGAPGGTTDDLSLLDGDLGAPSYHAILDRVERLSDLAKERGTPAPHLRKLRSELRKHAANEKVNEAARSLAQSLKPKPEG